MQEPSKLGKIVLISMRCRMKLTEKKTTHVYKDSLAFTSSALLLSKAEKRT